MKNNFAGVEIHPSSLVSDNAKIGKGTKIGPFCIVGPNVEIGESNTIKSHAVIEGHTKIGNGNTFHQFCSIGDTPQDTTYKGEPTRVEIGDNNIFREYNSIHRATMKEVQLTKIGSNNLFMSYVHLAHDVVIGNKVTFANSVNLAGHVHVGDRVIIGGATNIGQFISLGRGAYIGGASAIDKDIPPFCTAYGNRIRLKGINIIGMKRQGYTKQEISDVVDFFRMMEASALSSRSFVEHEEFIKDYNGNKVIEEIREFVRKSETGIAPFMFNG